jgi:RNA polymerase sigma-70 factor (ECF subfamily)
MVGAHGGGDGGPGNSGWPSLAEFLRRMFQALGARSADADDLAQESIARVLGRPGATSAPVSLGYAATVGRNLWRDQLRQRLRRRPPAPSASMDDVPAIAAGPEDSVIAAEERARLAAALAALDPRHGDAIRLVVLEGRSYGEAAALMGVPRGTIKSRIHYGLERLRSELRAPPTRRGARGRSGR